MEKEPATALDEMTKKEEDLKRKLDWLRGQGDASQSSRNAMIADNEVAWEHGAFRKERRPPPDWKDGFIVRTRRDALHAKLNSVDILQHLERIEAKISEMRKVLAWFVPIVGVAALYVLTQGLVKWWGN